MTREEELYYETYFDLFLTNGWKQFVSEIDESVSSYRIEDLTNEKDLYLAQGNLQTLKRIASFEAGIRNAYDMMTEVENDPSI